MQLFAADDIIRCVFVDALRVSIEPILFSVRILDFDAVSPGHIQLLTKNGKDFDSFA